MLEGYTKSSNNHGSSALMCKLSVPIELSLGSGKGIWPQLLSEALISWSFKASQDIPNISNPAASQALPVHFSASQRLSLDVTQHFTAKCCVSAAAG